MILPRASMVGLLFVMLLLAAVTGEAQVLGQFRDAQIVYSNGTCPVAAGGVISLPIPGNLCWRTDNTTMYSWNGTSWTTLAGNPVAPLTSDGVNLTLPSPGKLTLGNNTLYHLTDSNVYSAPDFLSLYGGTCSNAGSGSGRCGYIVSRKTIGQQGTGANEFMSLEFDTNCCPNGGFVAMWSDRTPETVDMNVGTLNDQHLYFITNYTHRWLIGGASGDYAPALDNTYNIGVINNLRPATYYGGTAVIAPRLRASATTTTLTLNGNEIGQEKMASAATAPGAAGAKQAWICGTNAGTLKLVVYGGTSSTGVTVIDNVGAGATGC